MYYFVHDVQPKFLVMENFYEVHKKNVHGVSHYFVKHFISFKDLPELAPVLKGYGMHIDLHQACHLAGIHSCEIINTLKVKSADDEVVGRVVQLHPRGLLVNISK